MQKLHCVEGFVAVSLRQHPRGAAGAADTIEICHLMQQLTQPQLAGRSVLLGQVALEGQGANWTVWLSAHRTAAGACFFEWQARAHMKYLTRVY